MGLAHLVDRRLSLPTDWVMVLGTKEDFTGERVGLGGLTSFVSARPVDERANTFNFACEKETISHRLCHFDTIRIGNRKEYERY